MAGVLPEDAALSIRIGQEQSWDDQLSETGWCVSPQGSVRDMHDVCRDDTASNSHGKSARRRAPPSLCLDDTGLTGWEIRSR